MHPLHHFVYLGHEEEIFNLNMDFHRSLIPYCKEYGNMVGVENMWGSDDAFVPIGAKYMADIGKHLIERINAARSEGRRRKSVGFSCEVFPHKSRGLTHEVICKRILKDTDVRCAEGKHNEEKGNDAQYRDRSFW